MKALVLLAHGTEEMEAVITCDILARAGITVVRAAVESEKEHDLVLNCANGMKIVADVRIEDVMEKLSDFSIIVLPGGSKGADTFCSVKFNHFLIINSFSFQNIHVQNALKHFAQAQHVAAICAAPLALRQAEIFQGARVTCYPSLEAQLTRGGHFVHDTSADTIIDGRLITSRGPATAIDFALNTVKVLKGELVSKKVAGGILFH